MNTFYIGLHDPGHAWPFSHSMISVNRLRRRKTPFRVNRWMMDSGAFTEISTHGNWRDDVDAYIEQIDRWQSCGTLEAAVSQDVMCEPFILERTGRTIEHHQAETIERYCRLIEWVDETYVMPVLQGYSPASYVEHLNQYGALLGPNAWVGVGSVCKRNGNPNAIEDVLTAIAALRPDLRLHGFGIKLEALARPTVRALLYSCDSMAWSFHERVNGRDKNDPRAALTYCARVNEILTAPSSVQIQFSVS